MEKESIWSAVCVRSCIRFVVFRVSECDQRGPANKHIMAYADGGNKQNDSANKNNEYNENTVEEKHTESRRNKYNVH